MQKNWLIGALAVVIVIAGLAASFFVGVYFGYNNRPEVSKVTVLLNKETGKPESVDFSPFWKTWNIITEKYLADNGSSTASTTAVSEQDKVWGAISGLVASLGDPYSVFLPPEKNKRFTEDIAGNFGGVGMEIGVKEGILTVIAPLPDSPAKKAGIQPGDQIIKIDNKIVADLSSDEAVNLIRGEKGTAVKMTLQHKDAKTPYEVIVIRDTINIPTLETKKLPSGVFVISLYNFSAPSADLFRGALREFISANTDKLIIDLRGNPGGYLEMAVDIASWFLSADKPVVIEKQSAGEADKIYKSKGYDIFNKNLKMVILVDQGSASASEILAGALSEYGIAKLVGQKTFGKGSVQELIPVTAGSSVKITIAKWYTPKGHSISQNGLTPDILVEMTLDDIKNDQDPQLEAAVNFLLRKK